MQWYIHDYIMNHNPSANWKIFVVDAEKRYTIVMTLLLLYFDNYIDVVDNILYGIKIWNVDSLSMAKFYRTYKQEEDIEPTKDVVNHVYSYLKRHSGMKYVSSIDLHYSKYEVKKALQILCDENLVIYTEMTQRYYIK